MTTIHEEENRRTTNNLIEHFGVSVSLFRKGEQIRTPAGGVRRVNEPTTRSATKRYFGSTGGNPVVLTTANGERVSAGYVLIGDVEDDIQEDDEFVLDTLRYRVIAIDPVTLRYQRKGWCIRI